MGEMAPGAKNFQFSGVTYDAFMGRYSRSLAVTFADWLGVHEGQRVLDVGCGPGALTGELVARLGAEQVEACDPSEPFVADARVRFPGIDVQLARAEELPYEDDGFDAALTQLVLHFVSDSAAVAAELRRVVRPGGLVASTVWDFAEGMQMLRTFWDAALTVDPGAPDEAQVLRFGGAGEMSELWESVGLVDITEETVEVSSTYQDFDELWRGFELGVGPAGSYCTSLDPDHRNAVREALRARLGAPTGAFTLGAVARAASGRVPG